MRSNVLLPRLALVGTMLLLAVASAVWIVHSRQPPPDLSLQRVQRAGVLVVGLDPSYPPFEVDDGHGHLAGFDVDLASKLAGRLGVSVRFVPIDFGSIFDALEVGKLDAIIGGISPGADDRKTIAYSVPYFDDGLVLLENPGVSPRSIGIESGSDADLYQDELRAKLTGYQFTQFDDQSEIRASLGRRTLRGALLDAVTAEIWASQIPGLVVRPERLTTTPFVIAVRRSDQKLLRAIDDQIVALRASGEIAHLQQEWFHG